jgi:hypothetical protein
MSGYLVPMVIEQTGRGERACGLRVDDLKLSFFSVGNGKPP